MREAEIMLLCVRWYLRSALSYRDLEAHDAGAGPARRSYHHLPVGPALCRLRWRNDADLTSKPPPLLGGWMKPT